MAWLDLRHTKRNQEFDWFSVERMNASYHKDSRILIFIPSL
jgi:hypothetical protein